MPNVKKEVFTKPAESNVGIFLTNVETGKTIQVEVRKEQN